MKLYLVEDDATIAELMQQELEKWDYHVFCAKNFHHILNEFQECQPDLVLMDIKLPAYNGYHWCQEIRKVSTVPILFISSQHDSMDIVMAMQMGGDDFVEKPIDLPVLLAKIQALLRRSYDYPRRTLSRLTFATFDLDLEQHTLIYQKQSIPLTRTEFVLLKTLFEAQGGYVTRDALMEACWLGEDYIDDNTLAVNISRLRKKIRELGYDQVIVTKKQVGYAISKGIPL